MKLDRFDTGIPRFRVFRHGGRVESRSPICSFETAEGEAYTEVDPWDCFVLKRRDAFASDALQAYARSAEAAGQFETATHVRRLVREWADATSLLGDNKIPD